MAVVPYATGEQVLVSATAELGTSLSFCDNALQLFTCFKDATSSTWAPTSDEDGASTNGTIVVQFNNISIMPFTRDGVQQSGMTNGHTYDFGLCAIQTTGTTSCTWQNTASVAWGTIKGESKVVATVIIP
jgi:hypothetical protein